jgi:hypothetical protein
METRERSGATVEKDALLFLRLLTALLERRVTPRLVNIVNYDDDSNDEEVKVSESAKRTVSEIKFRFSRRVFSRIHPILKSQFITCSMLICSVCLDTRWKTDR